MCQRCLRTICHECQTQGAVGAICPECMKEQKQKRSPAQGKAERRWRAHTPSRAIAGVPLSATNVLVAITLFVGLFQLIPGLGVTGYLAFNSIALLPQSFEPWRALTALFVHGSFWHIALNMLGLWMLGRILEPMLGWMRFTALYLISGLGGSLLVALIAPATTVVGASGAIFGLLGALAVIGRKLGGNISGILVILGINLALGFIPGFNIAWQAHVGGLVTGAIVGGIFAVTRTRNRQLLQTLLLILLTLALGSAMLILGPMILLQYAGG